jgi:hypothetical protein
MLHTIATFIDCPAMPFQAAMALGAWAFIGLAKQFTLHVTTNIQTN